MKRHLYIHLLLVVFLSCSFSCKTNKHTNECEDVACTMMFAMVTVEITDSTRQKLVLDDFYTVNSETGEVIRPQQNTAGNGFVVLDDSYHSKLRNDTATFNFIGTKDGKEVVNEPYVISADCCHINKVSGKTIVSL